MLYDLADGVISLDAMHNPEYAKAAQETYEKDHNGPLGSPGMLMGFVSYASLVGPEKLEETIQEIRKNSRAKTEFAKKQEQVIIDQLVSPLRHLIVLPAGSRNPFRSDFSFTWLLSREAFSA